MLILSSIWISLVYIIVQETSLPALSPPSPSGGQRWGEGMRWNGDKDRCWWVVGAQMRLDKQLALREANLRLFSHPQTSGRPQEAQMNNSLSPTRLCIFAAILERGQMTKIIKLWEAFTCRSLDTFFFCWYIIFCTRWQINGKYLPLGFHLPWNCANWNCEQRIGLMQTHQFQINSYISQKGVIFQAIWEEASFTMETLFSSLHYYQLIGQNWLPGAWCNRSHKRLFCTT